MSSEKQVSASELTRQVLDVSRDAQIDSSEKERVGLGRIDVERSKRNVWGGWWWEWNLGTVGACARRRDGTNFCFWLPVARKANAGKLESWKTHGSPVGNIQDGRVH